ncbi:MAG: CDP-diacylglycerol--glycerol-3-phosphate 3-phosphatidyltransferase [Eggerthellaceae bacterium]
MSDKNSATVASSPNGSSQDSHDDAANAILTPANVVTMVRILLVPVFVVAIISPWPSYFPQWPDASLWKPWIAAAIFAVLSCTDAVDGYLARSRGEVTNFGKFIDPLADKILVAAALLALIELQLLPSWVALVILGREFIVSGLRMLVATHGIVVAASWYGKAKTVFQIIAILLFILKGSPMLLSLHEQMGVVMYVVSWFFMIVALVLTIVSMCDYFIKCAPIFGLNPKASFSNFKVPEKAFEASSFELASGENIVFEYALRTKASEVITLAKENRKKISTAESCTGGLIGATLTDVAGSSSVVEGGIISYSNEVKRNVLGVSEKDLARVGAVSSEVACEMAEGSRSKCKSDVAVSVTGIAGPGGAVPGKPVGTVWFGIATHEGSASFVRHFKGNRDQVRSQTVDFALTLFIAGLSEVDYPAYSDEQ